MSIITERRFHCPHCNFIQILRNDEPEPNMCGGCGSIKGQIPKQRGWALVNGEVKEFGEMKDLNNLENIEDTDLQKNL